MNEWTKVKKNTIYATVTSGNYAGKHLKIKIGKTGTDTKVFMNGKPLTNITFINISIPANDVTRIAFEAVEFG